jgi:hypothetical protein
VDLDMANFLGTNTVPLWKPKARGLQCNNPKLINKFNHYRKNHHENSKMEGKISQLNVALQEKSSVEEWSELFERLDQLRLEGILQADK